MEYMPAVSEAKGPARVAYVRGRVNEHCVEMLLDLGASCSVMRKDYVSQQDLEPIGLLKLVNADGRSLNPVGTTSLKVDLGNLMAIRPSLWLSTCQHRSSWDAIS